MINYIRRLFCFGLHDWEYSETHDVKECRKYEWCVKLDN